MNNKKKNIVLFTAFFILLSISIISYINFSGYQPKILKKIEDVKGAKSISDINLLYPDKAETISSDEIGNIYQTSYRIEKPRSSIESFYKNIFTDLDWEIESISEENNSSVYKYKSKDKIAKIISKEEATNTEGNEKIYTLVGIEISDRK